MTSQQTLEERRIANYAENEGQNRYRMGQPKTSCPWTDDARKFYFVLGWQAEKKRSSRIIARRALGLHG